MLRSAALFTVNANMLCVLDAEVRQMEQWNEVKVMLHTLSQLPFTAGWILFHV